MRVEGYKVGNPRVAMHQDQRMADRIELCYRELGADRPMSRCLEQTGQLCRL